MQRRPQALLKQSWRRRRQFKQRRPPKEKDEGEEAKEGFEEEGPGDGEKGVGSDKASGDTKVLESEKGPEVIEKEGNDVEELESDCVEIPKESVEETQALGKGTVERAERRMRRFSKRLARVIASGEVVIKVEKVDRKEIDPSSEKEEEEEIPLKGRTRAGRATDQVAPAIEGPEESSTTTPSTETVPPTPEDQPIPEAPIEEEEIQDEKMATPQSDQEVPEKQSTKEEVPEEGEGKTKIDEERYHRERKRKGKQPAKQVRKKARKANPTVTIQEPIQIPF